MNKSYKFRLYPNKEQEVLINKTFGCVRFIYNKMLSDRITHYKLTGEKLNNAPAQYKNEFEWLKEVDSMALCNAQMNLRTAYDRFFSKKDVGFPKFKSKNKTKPSYTTNSQYGSIKLLNNNKYIKLPKLKQVKIKCHREIGENEKIKSCTISKTQTGKYYCSLLIEYEKEIIKKKSDKVIALDYSSPSFYHSSEDKKANYPRYYRLNEEKLTKEQKKLSRKNKGSNNYNKQKIKVAKVHEKISNQRNDWLHKQSRKLVNEYDAIIIEDLNMSDMSQALKLGKSTTDNGWGYFKTFLKYKLESEGKQLVKINKWYPSSKTCSNCNNINTELKLGDKIYQCKECGLIIDRDLNASFNILRVGMTQLAW